MLWIVSSHGFAANGSNSEHMDVFHRDDDLTSLPSFPSSIPGVGLTFTNTNMDEVGAGANETSLRRQRPTTKCANKAIGSAYTLHPLNYRHSSALVRRTAEIFSMASDPIESESKALPYG